MSKPKSRDVEELSTYFSTMRDLLRYAVSRFNEAGLFFGHGSANAWDEAVHLVLHRLHLPLDKLDPFLDARLTEKEKRAVLDVIARRVDERMPAAYLTGEAWLGDYRFTVDPRVIVPRSYIAELLFEQLAPWIARPDQVESVLDLCTGSACLAIIAADAFPNAHVDAVDLSHDALAVAHINVDSYGLGERIDLIESDLCDGLDNRRYDLIVSNPPYVNDQSMALLPDEYRREPRMALAGGLDGLDLVRRILEAAPCMLTDDGLLVVEVGHERPHVEAAFPRLPLTWLSTSGGDDAVFAVRAANLTGKVVVKKTQKKRSR
ncbi:MAG: 50S ribosomal protein L3 N(5)-glutamine methyltransferase [Burkholderiaceae bacterium]